MTENKALYFSEAEFFLLFLLAGTKPCSICRTDTVPDDEEVLHAAVSLHSRGLLERQGERFIPQKEGLLFCEMKESGYAVLITAQAHPDRAVGCYLLSNRILVTERIPEGYRVFVMQPSDIKQWLIECGFLEAPYLNREDAGELMRLVSETLEPEQCMTLMQMEKYKNGEARLASFKLLYSSGMRFLYMEDLLGTELLPYTREDLTLFLSKCFDDA